MTTQDDVDAAAPDRLARQTKQRHRTRGLRVTGQAWVVGHLRRAMCPAPILETAGLLRLTG